MRDMSIIKKNLKSFPEVKGYFEQNYPLEIAALNDVIILEISEDSWKKFKLVGYGYVVRSNVLLSNYVFLEMAAVNSNYYETLPSDLHKRDVNFFRMWKNLNKPDFFIVIRQAPESRIFLVHELTHLLNLPSDFKAEDFQDDYLNDPREQFSHLSEIRFAQSKGLDFDTYFKTVHPDDYNYVEKYEAGDKGIPRQYYELSKMDERDYKRMWDMVKGTKIKTASIVKTAKAKLTKSNIKGKYGTFEAYLVTGDDYNDTYSIKDELKRLGFQFYAPNKSWWIASKKLGLDSINYLTGLGVENLIGTGIVQKPVTSTPASVSTQPSSVPLAEPVKTDKQWVTEDEEMTRWYGFPINKNIRSFEVKAIIDGDEHILPVTINRHYIMGGDLYHKTKSRKFKGIPRYIINVGKKDEENPLYKAKYTAKEKWGTYNEETLLDKLQGDVEKIVNDPKNAAYINLSVYYDYFKRDESFKKLLVDIENKNSPRYMLKLDEPQEYAGEYPVKLTSYSGDKATDLWVSSDLKHPLEKDEVTLGSLEIHLVHNIDEFNQRVREFLATDDVKERMLEHLKSFPFLQEQQQEAKKSFVIIQQYVDGGSSYADTVLRKIQEKGYIRPHKRQKTQGPGITLGEEIDWVVDSKKIVNDAYSFGSYLSTTPEYFYTVVAYYIHRKVRGIWSWTDMILIDVMGTWHRTMTNMGATFSFKEIEKAIEDIGNVIIQKVYGKETQEQKNKRFFEDFYGGQSGGQSGGVSAISSLANFAKEFGVAEEDITKENIKNVYRILTKKIHPDLYQDPVQKQEMTKKFQELQNIWDNLPNEYKVASSWYERYIFTANKREFGKFC